MDFSPVTEKVNSQDQKSSLYPCNWDYKQQ